MPDVAGALHITSEDDILTARTVTREAATEVGFGLTDVTRIVTAASELARNVHLYAVTGEMRWRAVTQAGMPGLELRFEDEGPGIADVAGALEGTFSTSRGLGRGLSGSRKLMDELTIESTVGEGTTVVTRKWLR